MGENSDGNLLYTYYLVQEVKINAVIYKSLLSSVSIIHIGAVYCTRNYVFTDFRFKHSTTGL